MPFVVFSAFASHNIKRFASVERVRFALPTIGRLLLLTLVALGTVWAPAARAQPLKFGLIAHYLVDDTKNCGDVMFGQASSSPSVQHDMQEGDTLELAAHGLCQIEIVNTSSLTLRIGLPSDLRALALHETLREEGKVPVEKDQHLSVLLRAFPPKQRMVTSVSSESGTEGAFTLNFH